MAAALVPLHVAAYTECFAAACMRALERLLTGMAMAVYAEAAGAREGFVTCRTDVTVLTLGEAGGAGCTDVVMMLPWIRCVRAGGGCKR